MREMVGERLGVGVGVRVGVTIFQKFVLLGVGESVACAEGVIEIAGRVFEVPCIVTIFVGAGICGLLLSTLGKSVQLLNRLNNAKLSNTFPMKPTQWGNLDFSEIE